MLLSDNRYLDDNLYQFYAYIICIIQNKSNKKFDLFRKLAGETRLEHATHGFGDRYSTIELLP